MEDPVTPLRCQGAYIQGSKQCLLLWAALGDHALRCPIRIDNQRLLYASQALRQEVYPDSQVALLEPKQHNADEQQGQKAGESMHRQCAVRPMRGRPPQAGASALADAKHRFRLGLAAVGQHHALRLKLLAVGKEDGLAEVTMLDRAFLAPITLPTQLLHPPVVEMEGGGKELLEPIVSHQLSDLALHRLRRAGTVACDSLLDGDAQLEQSLGGCALQQVQGAHVLALEGGAETDQQLPLDVREPLVGLAVDLESPAIGQGQGVILLQGNLVEAAHPAGRDGRQEGKWASV